MNFREAYLDDLDQAFFDLDEFASVHVIDGAQRTVILVGGEVKDSDGGALNPKEHAINRDSVIMHIRESDVWRKFSVNATLDMDGETMWIRSVRRIVGVNFCRKQG